LALPRTPQSGTWATNDAITATKLNGDPGGICALATSSSDQGSITSTETNLTSMTNTWTAVASRVYMHSISLMVSNGTDGAQMVIKITDSSNNELWRANIRQSGLSIKNTYTFTWFETGIAAASTNRKLRMVAATGTATIEGATGQSVYAILDVGPA
jgi:hypothetical protein